MRKAITIGLACSVLGRLAILGGCTGAAAKPAAPVGENISQPRDLPQDLFHSFCDGQTQRLKPYLPTSEDYIRQGTLTGDEKDTPSLAKKWERLFPQYLQREVNTLRGDLSQRGFDWGQAKLHRVSVEGMENAGKEYDCLELVGSPIRDVGGMSGFTFTTPYDVELCLEMQSGAKRAFAFCTLRRSKDGPKIVGFFLATDLDLQERLRLRDWPVGKDKAQDLQTARWIVSRHIPRQLFERLSEFKHSLDALWVPEAVIKLPALFDPFWPDKIEFSSTMDDSEAACTLRETGNDTLVFTGTIQIQFGDPLSVGDGLFDGMPPFPFPVTLSLDRSARQNLAKAQSFQARLDHLGGKTRTFYRVGDRSFRTPVIQMARVRLSETSSSHIFFVDTIASRIRFEGTTVDANAEVGRMLDATISAQEEAKTKWTDPTTQKTD